MSAEARTLPASFYKSNPGLVATANSLSLGDEWPEVELKAIKSCLTELKTANSERVMEVAHKISLFDDCAERWATMDIKAKKIAQ